MSKSDFEVNVMMFGGRRCGKTSILAAMNRCFDEIYGGTDLTICPADHDTMLKLYEKDNEIRGYFANRKMGGGHFVANDNLTKADSEYKFYISLKNKPGNNLILNFIDYPGEYLTDTSKMDKLDHFMEKSQIIIIAIDTPFLMEQCRTNEPDEVGPYNEKRNYCRQVSDMAKKHFKLTEGQKMIIFVPLKCEKYLPEQFNIIKAKICKAYGSLITHVTANAYNNACQVVVAPIKTFGSARFARFGKKEDGNGVRLDVNGLPAESIFKFDDNAESEPKPANCEIPMELVLLYLFDTARKVKQNKINKMNPIEKIIYAFGRKFLDWPGAKDFMIHEDKLRAELRKKYGTYSILSDPLRLAE